MTVTTTTDRAPSQCSHPSCLRMDYVLSGKPVTSEHSDYF